MLSTTKMLTRGQVVIPELVREQLNLHSGSEFVVIVVNDTIMLKTLQRPPKSSLKVLLDNVSSQARTAGAKKSDIEVEIKKYRNKSRTK